MSEPGNPNHIVRVSEPGPDGLSWPVFIIKKGDAFYATLAVWEYDPDVGATEEQKSGYSAIKKYFEEAKLDGDVLTAVEVPVTEDTVHCATCHPPRFRAVPTKPVPEDK